MNFIEEIAKLRLDIETPEDRTRFVKAKKVKKEKPENDRRGTYIRTPEMKKHLSMSMKKAWSRPDVREKYLNHLRLYMRTPEVREHFSMAHKGLVWWNDGVTETKAKECPEGMKRGRLPREHKKGLVWWTNGDKETTSKDCPGEGWYRGRK